jgi:hypothetical protein
LRIAAVPDGRLNENKRRIPFVPGPNGNARLGASLVARVVVKAALAPVGRGVRATG